MESNKNILGIVSLLLLFGGFCFATAGSSERKKQISINNGRPRHANMKTSQTYAFLLLAFSRFCGRGCSDDASAAACCLSARACIEV
jgi:hypothetical protein